jgi:hypothetical protein
MSDKKVITHNIYTVLDNELARMHELLRIYMQLPNADDNNYTYKKLPTNPSNMGTIYKRIIDLQNVVLMATKSADAEIQKAVAELALTGSDENT